MTWCAAIRRLSFVIEPVAVPDLLHYRVAVLVNIELHAVSAGARPKASRQISPERLGAADFGPVVQTLEDPRDPCLNRKRKVLKLLLRCRRDPSHRHGR